MNAIRIRKKLESSIIDVPEAAGMIGRNVEIIILEEPLAGVVTDSRDALTALDQIAGTDIMDFEAVEDRRRISKI